MYIPSLLLLSRNFDVYSSFVVVRYYIPYTHVMRPNTNETHLRKNFVVLAVFVSVSKARKNVVVVFEYNSGLLLLPTRVPC